MTTTETTTETEELETSTTPNATAGVGGIVGDMGEESTVSTLEELVELIQSKRQVLLTSNKKNVEVFNDLQSATSKMVNNLTALDGAIAGISEFITDETDENDAHITKLKELTENRNTAVDELKNVASRRAMLITAIQATEISLGIINGILHDVGSSTTESNAEKVDELES